MGLNPVNGGKLEKKPQGQARQTVPRCALAQCYSHRPWLRIDAVRKETYRSFATVSSFTNGVLPIVSMMELQ